MILEVKRINPDAELPARAHATDAGFDLTSPATVTVGVGATVRIPSGIAIALPSGTVGLVYPRSGLGIKHGIVLANTVGVIDQDYRGEIILAVRNQGNKPYTIHAGDRVAQMIVTPYMAPLVTEVEALGTTVRGINGLGSTG